MHKKVHSKITGYLKKAYKNVGGLDVPIPLNIVSLLVEFNHFNDLSTDDNPRMERVFHSVLASRVLLHIRHQASNNNWTIGLTDHLSDLTNTMTLQDKNSRARKTISTFP